MKFKLFYFNSIYFVIQLFVIEIFFYLFYISGLMEPLTLDETVKYGFLIVLCVRIFYLFWRIKNDKIHLFMAGFVYNLFFYLFAMAFKLPNYESMIFALNFIFINDFYHCIKNKSYQVPEYALFTEKQIQEFEDKNKDDEFYDI